MFTLHRLWEDIRDKLDMLYSSKRCGLTMVFVETIGIVAKSTGFLSICHRLSHVCIVRPLMST